MIVPICDMCAKLGSTQELCLECTEKLRSGKISEQDVIVSNFLYNKYQELEVEYISSFATQKYLLLFMRGKVARIIGDGSGIIPLEEIVGKRIKIINVGHDLKGIVSDIIHPATLVGINILFSSGKKKYRIRIAKEDLGKFPFEVNVIRDLLSKMLKAEAQLSFE